MCTTRYASDYLDVSNRAGATLDHAAIDTASLRDTIDSIRRRALDVQLRRRGSFEEMSEVLDEAMAEMWTVLGLLDEAVARLEARGR